MLGFMLLKPCAVLAAFAPTQGTAIGGKHGKYGLQELLQSTQSAIAQRK
jgi:hypothetical protein